MKKIKISFIDICIVIAALLVVVAGFIFLKPSEGVVAHTQKVNFTVLCTNQDAGISQLINAGDDVVISFSQDVHATVTEAYEEPYKASYFNGFTGKYVTGKHEGKSDIFVKLTCDATVSDTSISNGSLAIRVGDAMPVRGKGYVVTGYVVDVTEE